ncbi:MAG: twin-arginine translocase subunit TatC [Actinomycetes bacterium]
MNRPALRRTRPARGDDGRMTLTEHLREFRSRVVKSALAICAAGILGWVNYDRLFQALQHPLKVLQHDRPDALIGINFQGVTDAFNLKVQVAIYTGLLIASPVWLYQLWAFITPGLHRHERRYAIGFVAAAVPLFCGGAYLAWRVMPKAIEVLVGDFTPSGGNNLVPATDYLDFVTRFMLAFGLAFLLPVLLVGLNMAGILPAARIARAWRLAVTLIFLFTAIVTPTPDPATLVIISLAVCSLYVVALGVCLLNERRRGRRAPVELSDEEAAPLEPALPVEPAAPVDPAPEVSADAERVPFRPRYGASDSYDDEVPTDSGGSH